MFDKLENLPFDISTIRTFIYSFEYPDIENCKNILLNVLLSIEENKNSSSEESTVLENVIIDLGSF